MLAGGDAVGTSGLETASSTPLWRNTSPPSHIACHLPLEVLQKIFLFLVDLYVAQNLFYSYSFGRPDWIAITYVCRHWREAALGLRTLWSSIIPDLSISWSRVMIERSAPLPMYIDMHIRPFYVSGIEPVYALGLILTASGARTLRLSGGWKDILIILNNLRSSSLLESLNIHVIGPPFVVILPEALFNRDAPHLRHLTFDTTMEVRGPRWLFAGITHFTTSAGATLHVFLDVLRAMPQLEMLCISNMFSVWDDIDGLEQVPLPRLALLSFRGPVPHRFMILSPYINSPPTVRRHLSLKHSAVSWDSWKSTLVAMRAFIPCDSAPGNDDGDIRIVRIMGGSKSGSFELWSRTGSESAGAGAAAREEALFLFHVNWDFWHDVESRSGPFFYFPILCTHFHTTRVEDLTVAPKSTPRKPDMDTQETLNVAATWQALLAALPSVKTLRLHRGNPGCLAVLRVLSASAGLLPHLQRIFVVQSTVRYDTASVVLWGPIDVASASTNFVMASCKFMRGNVGEELVEAVSKRSGLEVVLVGCNVDEEALEALRKQARVDIIEEEWAYVQEYM